MNPPPGEFDSPSCIQKRESIRIWDLQRPKFSIYRITAQLWAAAAHKRVVSHHRYSHRTNNFRDLPQSTARRAHPLPQRNKFRSDRISPIRHRRLRHQSRYFIQPDPPSRHWKSLHRMENWEATIPLYGRYSWSLWKFHLHDSEIGSFWKRWQDSTLDLESSRENCS